MNRRISAFYIIGVILTFLLVNFYRENDTPRQEASAAVFGFAAMGSQWPGGGKAEAMPAINYKHEMVGLIEQISSYSKARHASFQVIGNNGLELFRLAEMGTGDVERMTRSVDGILLESFFYGWDLKDDVKTPASVRRYLENPLAALKGNNIPILNIDYCQDRRQVDNSYQLNARQGMVSFAANSRQLDSVPDYPAKINRENGSSIRQVSQAKNFLILLNPHKYQEKSAYLAALRNTNYDLVIVDLYFNGEALTVSDIASLKLKKNGASRPVLAYLSVGEAEDYRAYWQPAWNQQPPVWLAENNPDWPGNYKVRYWTKEWQALLLGSETSYLDRILAAGFDGVFLDVIDAYDYFAD